MRANAPCAHYHALGTALVNLWVSSTRKVEATIYLTLALRRTNSSDVRAILAIVVRTAPWVSKLLASKYIDLQR